MAINWLMAATEPMTNSSASTRYYRRAWIHSSYIILLCTKTQKCSEMSSTAKKISAIETRDRLDATEGGSYVLVNLGGQLIQFLRYHWKAHRPTLKCVHDGDCFVGTICAWLWLGTMISQNYCTNCWSRKPQWGLGMSFCFDKGRDNEIRFTCVCAYYWWVPCVFNLLLVGAALDTVRPRGFGNLEENSALASITNSSSRLL